ncbi:MAG: hypothetical protein RIQ94_2394 [Pseudomonadota bacterium]
MGEFIFSLRLVDYLILFFWLITLFYFLTKRPALPVVIANDEAELSLKTSINQLKKACADNNAPAAKNALLAWGLLNFGVTSLGMCADCCDARLRDEILQLNEVLYAKDGYTQKTHPRGRVKNCFKPLLKIKPERKCQQLRMRR